LVLDTSFIILTDTTLNIDWQDYTIYYTLQFQVEEKEHIINQIEHSKYYNHDNVSYNDTVFWNQIVSDSLKGYWESTKNGYQFNDLPVFEGYVSLQDKSWVVKLKIDTSEYLIDYSFYKL